MTRPTSRPTPTFCRVGENAYQLTVAELGIQLTIDRLRRERGELIGELAVGCDLAGARTIDGYLSIADFNLSSAQARTTRAKLLADRSDAADIDWHGLVEELSVRTITAEREGAPSQPLHTFERQGVDAAFSIDGWSWPRDHAMITFADGGALKSYLALYGAGVLAQRGVPTGYCDWELSGVDHRERLERLFGAAMPTIAYLRCDRPLVEEIDRITREVHRLGLEYLIFDSAGFGTAGAPEAAEEALRYFRCVRRIGVGSHHLAHITKANDTAEDKPFGSAFWHNSARATWFAKQTATSMDGKILAVGLYNRKANLTRKYPAVAFQFDFRDDTRTVVSRIEVADVDDLAGQLPIWMRVKAALTHGPKTLATLADELGEKVNTLNTTIRRRDGLFMRVSGEDGITRIALVERREAS